jgi:hypothetical protein
LGALAILPGARSGALKISIFRPGLLHFAFDERIRACNFVPGLGQVGETYDLAGLAAPRPMLVEAGTQNGIFPIGAVKESVSRANAVYSVFGDSLEVETDYFEGRHQISGKRAYEFLKQILQ